MIAISKGGDTLETASASAALPGRGGAFSSHSPRRRPVDSPGHGSQEQMREIMQG